MNCLKFCDPLFFVCYKVNIVCLLNKTPFWGYFSPRSRYNFVIVKMSKKIESKKVKGKE